MIYSKFDKFYNFSFKNTKLINECEYNEDDIFYYHPYYKIHNGVNLINSLNESHWDHMKKNKLTKLIYENATETLDESLIYEIKFIIENKGLSPSQIYMIVIDEIHRSFLIEQFQIHKIEGIHIGIYNLLMNKVNIPSKRLKINKKFSALSRNYRPWRLHVYSELVDRDLIDNFNYSFYNIDAYDVNVSINKIKMLNDLEKNNFKKISTKIKQWISGIPYKLKGNVYNKWSDVSYNCILSSDFHLLIETHYDTFNKIKPTFVTEKTFKVIACNKPFIVFSTPNFLKDIQKYFGFKTFSPWINESYDLEFNNHRRLEMISDEIERLIKLPPDQYDKILNECNRISLENLEIFQKKVQEKKDFNKDFDFLKEHIYESTDIPIF